MTHMSHDAGRNTDVAHGGGNGHADADHEYQEPAWTLNEHERFTDMGNAVRLELNCADRLRSVPERGWMYYDGSKNVWQHDANKVRVRQECRNIVGEMHRWSTQHVTNQAESAVWGKHITHSLSGRALDYMLEHGEIMPQLHARIADFDADPYLLNTPNGVVNLADACRMQPPTPSLLLSRQTHAQANATATCPRWERFLQDIFTGDTDLIRWVQKAAGYSLTGDTREQCFFVLYGNGSNGKSTLVDTLAYVLGDYARPMTANNLMDNRYRNPSGPDSELVACVGARFVHAQEPKETGWSKGPQGPSLDTGRIKELTGGDAVSVRDLHEKSFTFHPQFKLWLSVNNKPKVAEVTTGIWRRIRLIPFTAKFEGPNDNKRLKEQLQAEADGILRWLLDGYAAWQREGLAEAPAAVREATQDYRATQDDHLPFFTEVLMPAGADEYVLVHDAWNAFTAWRTSTDYESSSINTKQEFARSAEQHGYPYRPVRRRGPDKNRMALFGCKLHWSYRAQAA